jgi:hypothetical protein
MSDQRTVAALRGRLQSDYGAQTATSAAEVRQAASPVSVQCTARPTPASTVTDTDTLGLLTLPICTR